jgi:hypothetical protein
MGLPLARHEIPYSKVSKVSQGFIAVRKGFEIALTIFFARLESLASLASTIPKQALKRQLYDANQLPRGTAREAQEQINSPPFQLYIHFRCIARLHWIRLRHNTNR